MCYRDKPNPSFTLFFIKKKLLPAGSLIGVISQPRLAVPGELHHLTIVAIPIVSRPEFHSLGIFYVTSDAR
jgi:hypothetical protein